jgi:hypothetical protein
MDSQWESGADDSGVYNHYPEERRSGGLCGDYKWGLGLFEYNPVFVGYHDDGDPGCEYAIGPFGTGDCLPGQRIHGLYHFGYRRHEL